MEARQKCKKPPIKDLQLLVQFGISKQVQIRLIKLKLENNKHFKDIATGSEIFKTKSINSYSLQNSIQTHDKNRHHVQQKSKRFKCHLCKYFGTQQKYLTAHLRTHSQDRPIICNLCNYKALNRNCLNQHLQTDHNAKRSYICQFCTMGIVHFSDKKRHELRCRQNPNHNDAQWMYENRINKCHLCPYSSWTAADLKLHLRIHFGEKPYPCNLCTYKFSHKSTLNRHILTHTKEKPFKCLQCDYSAATKKDLRNHTKCRHTNEIRKRNFPCNLCPNKFYSRSELYAHILRHTGETPFVCQFCKNRFNANGSKTRHEKICKQNPKRKDKNWVEEQKVFKCELCQYSCIVKASLDVHLRRHTGSKPFQCFQCSYRSASSSDLKVHSKQHTKNQSF